MNAPALTVLLVEDDEVVRSSMAFALASEHLRIIEAGSVAEALARCQDAHCAVVVIDLHLPDGSGYDLAERLGREHPHLPLLMISTDFADSACQAPPTDRRLTLLTKPFSASDLLDAISRAVASAAGSGTP